MIFSFQMCEQGGLLCDSKGKLVGCTGDTLSSFLHNLDFFPEDLLGLPQ